MSSKFFGNGKLKGQPNKDQKNKFKSGSKGKATTAIRKTGRGNWEVWPNLRGIEVPELNEEDMPKISGVRII